ncbi:hypothetical protein ABZ816_29280 [Actinosynnema sp. NPDC047251]|nr:hypothetical protein [Saccharothrix espanaensis]
MTRQPQGTRRPDVRGGVRGRSGGVVSLDVLGFTQGLALTMSAALLT